MIGGVVLGRRMIAQRPVDHHRESAVRPGAPRATRPYRGSGQLAVQITSGGTRFWPCHDPRNPKVVPAPGPRSPL